MVTLCERLINPKDAVPIPINRYYSKVGQYSDEWNHHEAKKKDLLLRILRILHKCQGGIHP